MVLTMCTCVLLTQFCPTLWTVARQAPLSLGFSRQEYWSRLPFPSLGDLPNPGLELGPPIVQVDSVLCEPQEKPGLDYGDSQQ